MCVQSGAEILSASRLMSLEVGGSDRTKCHCGGATDGRPVGSEMCRGAEAASSFSF